MWTCTDPTADAPIVETHARPVRVVHPLANRDAEVRDASALEVVVDIFNLNRRPGEIYLAV